MQFGESAEEAILREIQEELACPAQIIRPLWLAQSFFTEEVSGEAFHELCLYFLIEVPNISKADFTVMEKKRENHFFWLDFQQLQEEVVYPKFLREEIFRLPEHLTMRIEREN